MRTIRRFAIRAVAVVIVAAGWAARIARADFHTVVTPAWNGEVNTTSQVWTPMTSSTTVPTAGSPQSPTVSPANPNGTAGWYDANAASDGAFVIGSPGGDVYSFAAVISPAAIVPGYNLAGNSLNVFIEAQSFGGAINTNDLTATYSDASGVHSVLASSLASFQYVAVYNDGGTPFGGFGTAYTIDHEWTFTLPKDMSSLQLSWGWGATSSAIQDLAIFTQSVTVASSSSWTASAGTQNWNDAGNWSAGVPGAISGTSGTASVVFDSFNPANPVPLIDTGRNLQNITFDNSAGHLTGSLALGTTSGNPLLLTGGGTIQTTSSVANSQAVNAPLVLEGSYTFNSGAANSTATLSFSGGISPGATSGVTTLTLKGTNSGANAIAGALADNGPGQLAVAKNENGTWILSGPNSFTGGVSVAAGTLSATSIGSLGSGPLVVSAADTITATVSIGANQSVSSLSGTVAGSGQAVVAIGTGTTLAVNQSADTTFAGGLNNSGIFAKTGSGSLELDGAPQWNDNSQIQVNGGTLRLKIDSGTVGVGTRVTAKVATTATLELAGSVSALSAGANRVNISNDSQALAGGLSVSGTHQQVGEINGAGNVVVDAGSDLTANHIIQNALIIGGTASNPATVTIAASTPSGSPMLDSETDVSSMETNLELLAAEPSLTGNGFGTDQLGASNLIAGGGDASFALQNPAGNINAADVSGVPEPSSLATTAIALACLIGNWALRQRTEALFGDGFPSRRE